MLTIFYLLVFTMTVALILSFAPGDRVYLRPRLRPLGHEPLALSNTQRRRMSFLKKIALFNKPLCIGPLGRRINKDIVAARKDLTAEEFLAVKEILIAAFLFLTFPLVKPDFFMFWVLMCFVFGYYLPEMWLKGQVKKVRQEIINDLPDVIDLLSLCVNAGLDFMLALKWVVDKSKQSVVVRELNLMMQEINVGKPRRVALSDLAKKFEISDLSSFTRSLIQADRMGTSVAEALNILSEDMRMARYRRGEQIALKAPIKMLVPLLLFIFPVVGILVAAPVFLDFMKNNPMQQINTGIRGK